QVPRFAANAALERAPAAENAYRVLPSFRLRDGGQAEEVSFDLGYAAAATASYRVFRDLKGRGVIARGVRFQVSLPTALALVIAFIAPDDQRALGPRIEAALHQEIEDIAAVVPLDELAVQWDVAVEIGRLEGTSQGGIGRRE